MQVPQTERNMAVSRMVAYQSHSLLSQNLRVFRLKHAMPKCSFKQLATSDLKNLLNAHFQHWKYDETSMDLIDLTGVFEAVIEDIDDGWSRSFMVRILGHHKQHLRRNQGVDEDSWVNKTRAIIEAIVGRFEGKKIQELRLPLYEYCDNGHSCPSDDAFIPQLPLSINKLLLVSACIGFLSPSELCPNRQYCKYLLQDRYRGMQQQPKVYLFKECTISSAVYRHSKPVVFNELSNGWEPIHSNTAAARLTLALELADTELTETQQQRESAFSYDMEITVTMNCDSTKGEKHIRKFLDEKKNQYKQLEKSMTKRLEYVYRKSMHCDIATIRKEEEKLAQAMSTSSESNKCHCIIMIKCYLTAANCTVRSSDEPISMKNSDSNSHSKLEGNDDPDEEDDDELHKLNDSSDGTYSSIPYPRIISQHDTLERLFKPRYYWNLNDSDYRGDGKVIAFIDTGIDETHPAFFKKEEDPLTTRVCLAVNFTGDDGYVRDESGHGTLCAGIACGGKFEITQTSDDIDLYEQFRVRGGYKSQENDDKLQKNSIFFPEGIAPDCKVVVFKVGRSHSQLDHNAVDEALKLIKEKCNGEHTAEGYPKVDVVSLSLGQMNYSWKRERAVTDLVAAGFIIVCAASNFGHQYQQSICYPARLGHVLCIGSHNAHGKPSDYCPIGQEMDFLAPGDDVVGPWPLPTKYKKARGTSFASAAVSGLVCLILECLEKLNKGEILKAIEKKVHKDGGQTSCNHWMIKEILRNMATNPGIHFSERGYGSLQPDKFFGNPEYFLRSTFGLKQT